MNKARNISLFAAVVTWATLVGGIMYSHVVFLSAYLHHLPQSTSLIKGEYRIADENFWIPIHPVLLLSLAVTVLFNWKQKGRRSYLLAAVAIYVAVLAVTFTYFVPELKAFAESATSSIPLAEWHERGLKWEKLSWIRGAFMYMGFFAMLAAFRKPLEQKSKVKTKNSKEAAIQYELATTH